MSMPDYRINFDFTVCALGPVTERNQKPPLTFQIGKTQNVLKNLSAQYERILCVFLPSPFHCCYLVSVDRTAPHTPSILIKYLCGKCNNL